MMTYCGTYNKQYAQQVHRYSKLTLTYILIFNAKKCGSWSIYFLKVYVTLKLNSRFRISTKIGSNSNF